MPVGISIDNKSPSQSGFVMLAVLLAILALTIVIAATIAAAKRSNDVFVLNRTQLEHQLKLEDALSVVTNGLRETPEVWVPRQAPYVLSIGEDKYEVRLQASAGLVDLNTAEPSELERLFLLAGADQDTARQLAEKVSDWRDIDSLTRLKGGEQTEYKAANLQIPRNGAFLSIQELNLVMGFDKTLVTCLSPFLTLDSGLPKVVGPFAPLGLSSFVEAQLTESVPELTIGSGVEIEVSHRLSGRLNFVTSVVRSTGRSRDPVLIHSFEMKARPIRDVPPSCFNRPQR